MEQRRSVSSAAWADRLSPFPRRIGHPEAAYFLSVSPDGCSDSNVQPQLFIPLAVAAVNKEMWDVHQICTSYQEISILIQVYCEVASVSWPRGSFSRKSS